MNLTVLAAPVIFPVAYNVVKSFLSESTKRKTVILGSKLKFMFIILVVLYFTDEINKCTVLFIFLTGLYSIIAIDLNMFLTSHLTAANEMVALLLVFWTHVIKCGGRFYEPGSANIDVLPKAMKSV